MANKWTTELGQSFLNTLAMPAEMVTGQNFYDPTFTSKLGKGLNATHDVLGGVGAALAPTALEAIAPGSGKALTLARSVTPDLGKGGTQLEGHNNNQSGFAMGQAAGQLAPQVLGGMGVFADGGYLKYLNGGVMPPERTGSNLSEFDGPSHENGGMKIAPNVEIEKKETKLSNYIFSDKNKVPGTDKTFAEMSKKYKSKDTDDDITKRTNNLMLERLKNNQEEYNAIQLAKQQAKLAKKEAKMFREGGYYTPAEAEAAGKRFISHGNVYGSAAGNYGGKTTYDNGGVIPLDQGDALYGFVPGANDPSVNIEGMDTSGSSVVPIFDAPGYQSPQLGDAFNTWTPEAQVVNDPQFNRVGPISLEEGDAKFGYVEGVNDMPGDPNPTRDWKGTINELGKYAPIAYNLFQGTRKPDYFDPTINTQMDKAIDLASNMRWNADPMLAEARRTFGQGRSALQNAASSEAAYLAGVQGLQQRADRQKYRVLADKENRDNAYKLQEAQLRANLGAQEAGILNQSELYRLKTDAARRAHTGQAMADIGKVSQTNQLMSGQKATDDLLAEGLKMGYPYEVIQKMLSK